MFKTKLQNSRFLIYLCFLQESIRNSADSMLISAPDSLVVSLSKNQGSNSNEQSNTTSVPSTPRISRGHIFGMDGLDLLKFTYKVCPIFSLLCL